MEIENNNPEAPVPAGDPAGSVPETGTPKASPSTGGLEAGAPVPAGDPAGSVPETGTPKASPSTGGLETGAPVPAENATGSAPAQAAKTPEPAAPSTPTASPAASEPAAKVELPKTTGTTVGGWNRFAGYNPNAAKNKPKGGREGSKGRR